MKPLIFLLSLFLVACGSSPDQPPKVNNISLNIFHVFDVIKQDNNSYTFSWLSRSQSQPLRLAQFTLQDGEKVSQEIYQWADGDKHLQKINISADGESIPQYVKGLNGDNLSRLDLDIRFAEKGVVVFQKILLNNRFYQVTPDNLHYLEADANRDVNLLKDRNRHHLRTYQGIWQYGVFTDCDGEMEHDVSFWDSTTIPEEAFVIIRAYSDEPWLFGDEDLEDAEIIWQSDIHQQCIKAPE